MLLITSVVCFSGTQSFIVPNKSVSVLVTTTILPLLYLIKTACGV